MTRSRAGGVAEDILAGLLLLLLLLLLLWMLGTR